MDLNKHIITNDDGKPFHSSGIAKIANGDRLGATANISFEQRRQIDKNRQLITNYQRSNLGSVYSELRARSHATRIIKLNPTSSQLKKQIMPNRVNRHIGTPRHYDPYA